MADNFNVSQGTGITVAADDVSSVYYPRVKIDTGADGLTSAFTGTLGAVTNLAQWTITSIANVAAGTITNVNGGTITALGIGTISVGTVLNIGLRHGDEFATAVNLTGTATGTVRALVSGSAIYVTAVVISVESAGRVSFASGTPTIPILGTLQFNSNGGVAMQFDPPIRTVSGSALVYNQSGTGAMSVTATGYID